MRSRCLRNGYARGIRVTGLCGAPAKRVCVGVLRNGFLRNGGVWDSCVAGAQLQLSMQLQLRLPKQLQVQLRE